MLISARKAVSSAYLKKEVAAKGGVIGVESVDKWTEYTPLWSTGVDGDGEL